MHDWLAAIIGGLVVAFIAWLFGINGSSKTIIQGTRVRRTGKWVIIIAVSMLLGGLYWSNTNQVAGYTLAAYGALFFIVGRIVAWFQRM